MTTMDVQFVKPFLDGTLNTLKTQCNMESKPGKPFLKGTEDQAPFDIAGVIGITSPAFSGSITLCFPEKVYLALISNMLGEKFEVLTPELEDGAAELLNIIFGQAKIILNQKGFEIEKAIPTVIRGTAMQTKHITSAKTIVLPFDTDAGRFMIEVSAEGTSLV